MNCYGDPNTDKVWHTRIDNGGSDKAFQPTPHWLKDDPAPAPAKTPTN